jgi:tetratricopeptide (TPR) repeat protein
MKISNINITGNQAEAFIGSVLSKFCLVRQVSSGTDIGVDLYCELIKDNKPEMHFWVQVKGKFNGNLKILQNTNQASYSFNTKHLKYWKEQPVPVFVFLVMENSDDIIDFPIYIVNITEELLSINIDSSKDTQSIHSHHQVNSINELREYLSTTLEITSARQKFEYGIISPIKSSKDNYEQALFPAGSRKFASKIFTTIRQASAFVLIDILESSEENHMIEPFINIIQSLNNLENWEIHYALGLAYISKQQYIEARESLQRAKNIINKDSTISISDQSWKKILIKIEDKLASLSKPISD